MAGCSGGLLVSADDDGVRTLVECNGAGAPDCGFRRRDLCYDLAELVAIEAEHAGTT